MEFVHNVDTFLCEDEIIHIEIWNKHRYTIILVSITEVKLRKLYRLQNNKTRLNGGSLPLRRYVMATCIHQVSITKRPMAFLT